MARVVGCDPGTSSLDLLLWSEGRVVDQARFMPQSLADGAGPLLAKLDAWAPLDLVAGPSGYGLPLVRGEQITPRDIALMALPASGDLGVDAGIAGFRSRSAALVTCGHPLVFLPGGIHLPTIPAHRKLNAVDMGTADKIAVAALALWFDTERGHRPAAESTFCVAEIGSAFTALLVVDQGRVVDAAAGSRGPIGLKSGGAWDGEVACLISPLSKRDVFRGGLVDMGEPGLDAFLESLIKHSAGLRAVTPFDRIYLSGAGLADAEVGRIVARAFQSFEDVRPLPSLDGAWVKHAAQGAALIADGLMGGECRVLIEALRLREASGTCLDFLTCRGRIGDPGRFGLAAD
ncbi:DUF1464 family protein [Isosphaeraceae bacterium EP7]